MKPKVIFVDGPTAVGKDYFITNFAGEYARLYPSDGIMIIRATDIVLKNDNVSELRKYTTYNTESQKLESIYDGHIDLLETIKRICEVNYSPGVVIVNRGFLSFIRYNLDSQPQDRGQVFIDRYSRDFKRIMKNIPCMALTLEAQHGQDTEYIIERIKNRQDAKPLDEQWIRTIYQRYRQYPPKQYADLFEVYMTATSSDTDIVLNHFQ